MQELTAKAEISLANEGEVKPKVLTRQEYKKVMGLYFTQRRQIVQPCGHKFHPQNEPRHSNCQPCWFVFFQNHGPVTQTAEEVFQKEGPDVLVRLKGQKFAKMFLKFLSTLAQLQKMQQEIDKKNEQNTGSTEGGVSSTERADSGRIEAAAAEVAELGREVQEPESSGRVAEQAVSDDTLNS